MQFDPVMREYQKQVQHIPPGVALIAAVQVHFPATDAAYIAQAGFLFAKMYSIMQGFNGQGPLQVCIHCLACWLCCAFTVGCVRTSKIR